jgi:hypothetical protein
MALLGILSILQAWFLPGILFVLFFKNIKILDNLVISVPLSLVLNYIIVYILVNFKIYNQKIFLLIITLEIILIISILLKRYKWKELLDKIDNWFSLDRSKNVLKIDISLLNFLILFLLIIYVFYALKNLGQSVHVGDPLDMWNQWAILWSKNTIPYTTEYPQAVPILYSISYILLNIYEVEFFTSAVCLIYPIWIFVTFFRLIYIFPEKKLLIKLSLITTTFFILSILRNYSLFIGYSDPILILTSTSAAFIFIYNYFENENKNIVNENDLKNVVLISLIAVAPAITKQMGLLISYIFPIFFFLINFLEKKILYKDTIIISCIIFVISISWYIFPFYHYYQLDFETTKFARLASQSLTGTELSNQSFLAKLSFGLDSLFWHFKYLVVILILFSLKNKFAVKVFLLIVLPYFIIWSLFFVVDARNFVMVSPFLGLLLSIGLINIIKLSAFFNFTFIKNLKIILLGSAAVLITISIHTIKNDEKIISKSIESKKLRGNQEINILLYNTFNYSKPDFDIISIPDVDFSYLPIIGERIIETSCDNFDMFISSRIISKSFYLLINNKFCNINKLFKEKKSNLELIEVFNHKNYIFYYLKSKSL